MTHNAIRIFSPFLVWLSIISTACTSLASTPVTPTSLPATQTHTQVPTITPLPTATTVPTKSPISSFDIDSMIYFEHAGFNYPKIAGYKETHRLNLVVFSSKDEKVLVGIAGGVQNSGLSLDEQLDGFLSNMSRDIESFSSTESVGAEIGETTGLSVDISGFLFGEEISGRVIYALPSNGQFIVIFGNAPTDRWSYEGNPLMETFQKNLTFFTPTQMTDNCPISTDPTYGYSEDNPIHVGSGDFLSGPSLERAYLDKISGPNGEQIAYERIGSSISGDLILDDYQITYGGNSKNFFLDMYSGEPFRVPLGFTCSS